VIKELLKLANHLDAKGLRKEADYLDDVIRKVALPSMPSQPVEYAKTVVRESKLDPGLLEEYPGLSGVLGHSVALGKHKWTVSAVWKEIASVQRGLDEKGLSGITAQEKDNYEYRLSNIEEMLGQLESGWAISPDLTESGGKALVGARKAMPAFISSERAKLNALRNQVNSMSVSQIPEGSASEQTQSPPPRASSRPPESVFQGAPVPELPEGWPNQ